MLSSTLRSLAACLLLAASAGAASAALPAAKCNEVKVFNRPAICWNEVPAYIKYRPRLAACGGNAGAILSGPFKNIFSIVLRDRNNSDRIPYCRPGFSFHGCSLTQCSAGVQRCSAAKVGKIIREAARSIYCFQAPGTSALFADVTRMTIKQSPVVVPGVTFIRVQLKTGRRGAARLALN